MISPINEWWIVAAFAVVTVVVATLAYLLRQQGEAPAILHGNGLVDDAPGLRAWLKGEPVCWAGGAPVECRLEGCIFRVESDWMIDPSEIDSPRHLVNCSIVDRRTGVSRQVMLLWGGSQAQ